MAEPREPAIPPEAMQRVERIGALMRMAGSLWVPRAIHAAAELGVADALADGPRPAADVAEQVEADPDSVHRLLRALATLGLVEQRKGEFALTPMGALLRSDTRDSLRSTVRLMAGPLAYRSWERLVDCVRTGRSAPQLIDDLDDPFEVFSDRPEERAVFDRSMAEGTRQIAGAVLLAYDFAGIRRIVDVGGGYGALLPPILRAHADMTAVVFDRAYCRAGAEQVFDKTRIADRARFVDGDFFTEALPSGADAYVLKAILHDWDDARSLRILQRCRQAMSEGSRLLVIEMVVPDRLEASDEGRQIVSSDLNMLVSTGGRERSQSEYRRLLEDAGLALDRVVPTIAGVSVIEARPRWGDPRARPLRVRRAGGCLSGDRGLGDLASSCRHVTSSSFPNGSTGRAAGPEPGSSRRKPRLIVGGGHCRVPCHRGPAKADGRCPASKAARSTSSADAPDRVSSHRVAVSAARRGPPRRRAAPAPGVGCTRPSSSRRAHAP